MKKNFRIAMVAIVMAVAGYGVYLSQNRVNDLSELELANVEALARSELGEKCGGCSTKYSTYCCTLIIEGVGTYTLGKP